LTVDFHNPSELPGEAARRAFAAQYTSLIADSTYSPEIEAAIEIACEDHRALNDAYVQYLAGSAKAKPGKPGYEGQSPRWREAEVAAFASVRTLAAVLGAKYNNPTGQIPIPQTQLLIKNRVGPLCNGWENKDSGKLTHHPKETCPVHG
jgi:hypothetical protein